MQMRSVYFFMVCLMFGTVTALSTPAFAAKSKEIEQKQAKLKKLGVKKKKFELVIQREKDLAKSLAKLEKEKPSARKKAKQKLVKAHEKFLKQTLGDKTYAAYYKSEPSRKIASEPAKKSKKKSSKPKAALKKEKHKEKKRQKAKPKHRAKKAASAPSTNQYENPSADPMGQPNTDLSPSETPEAAPTEAAADAQEASQMLAPEAIDGSHAPASVDPGLRQ